LKKMNKLILKKDKVLSQDKTKRSWQFFFPKQMLFLELYMDPKSPTFGNKKRSLLKAGYGKWYVNCFKGGSKIWFGKGVCARSKLLMKAERNLNELLDSGKEAIKLDASKFVTERLGKEVYSTRTESLNRSEKLIVTLPAEIVKKNNVELNPRSDEDSE